MSQLIRLRVKDNIFFASCACTEKSRRIFVSNGGVQCNRFKSLRWTQYAKKLFFCSRFYCDKIIFLNLKGFNQFSVSFNLLNFYGAQHLSTQKSATAIKIKKKKK